MAIFISACILFWSACMQLLKNHWLTSGRSHHCPMCTPNVHADGGVLGEHGCTFLFKFSLHSTVYMQLKLCYKVCIVQQIIKHYHHLLSKIYRINRLQQFTYIIIHKSTITSQWLAHTHPHTYLGSTDI